MTRQHDDNESSSPSEEPQAAEPTGELGQADEPWALPDGKATARERTAALKEHTIAKAKQAAHQVHEKTGQATELAKSKTPEPVLHTAEQTAAHVRDTASRAGHIAADKTPDAVREKAAQAAHVARSKWTALIPVGVALLVFVLIRHSRRNH
ncbi:hypothetical protein OG429_01520 [Streptomyces sp. NBC_00190]|uniref:hypothetical protein n=1 Tax=unclassified Streptomyces TaxID=2593676 RepID=UPI002E2D68E2|nr:hypothetical protein [Streptomyces sp. NBC_00190]WSZ38128.1 hypothetical protein OG239_04515 [Streptomyces sp. NBC_00868]